MSASSSWAWASGRPPRRPAGGRRGRGGGAPPLAGQPVGGVDGVVGESLDFIGAADGTLDLLVDQVPGPVVAVGGRLPDGPGRALGLRGARRERGAGRGGGAR